MFEEIIKTRNVSFMKSKQMNDFCHVKANFRRLCLWPNLADERVEEALVEVEQTLPVSSELE